MCGLASAVWFSTDLITKKLPTTRVSVPHQKDAVILIGVIFRSFWREDDSLPDNVVGFAGLAVDEEVGHFRRGPEMNVVALSSGHQTVR